MGDYMLRKKAIRKIIITTFVFFVVLTVYMIPSKNKKEELSYNVIKTKDVSVYLLNDYNQLTKVDFKVNDGKIKSIIESIINKLTISNDATIPECFIQLIPDDVSVIGVDIDEKIVNINFSDEFLNIPKEDIEKVVESISYSLLELKEINGVSIYVENDNIKDLYDNKFPSIITKEYGINKRVELKNLNDISKVIIYYLDNEDDTNYFVPITKYINDDREKIKIIIDELSSNYVYESNLISLLDKNIKLLDYQIRNGDITLDFSNSIFLEQERIIEEVVYSVFANYDVDNVIFKVNGEEILKKEL